MHVNNLSHVFDNRSVVNGVSVFVAPGEVVCLLGPSGCGKTTLLRVTAGLENIQIGQVLIGETIVDDGNSNIHVPPEKRGIGLMFQDYALFPHLTVRDNISFGYGADTPERLDWIEQALEQMKLIHIADQYPHILSGGEQQRVALLRALAPQPNVLLLDEPFSGLDVIRRTEVRGQTLKLIKDAGVATLLVTHDPEEAMFMADRILVMNNGRIIQDGTPEETYFAPQTEFVADLFGSVNRIAGTIHNGTLKTSVGIFVTKSLDNGDPAEVLIRPEAFQLTLADDNGSRRVRHPFNADAMGLLTSEQNFVVTGARTLGRASLISFMIPLSDGTEKELQARVTGVFLPEIGSRVTVTVNPNQAFVFPIKGLSS